MSPPWGIWLLKILITDQWSETRSIDITFMSNLLKNMSRIYIWCLYLPQNSLIFRILEQKTNRILTEQKSLVQLDIIGYAFFYFLRSKAWRRKKGSYGCLIKLEFWFNIIRLEGKDWWVMNDCLVAYDLFSNIRAYEIFKES